MRRCSAGLEGFEPGGGADFVGGAPRGLVFGEEFGEAGGGDVERAGGVGDFSFGGVNRIEREGENLRQCGVLFVDLQPALVDLDGLGPDEVDRERGPGDEGERFTETLDRVRLVLGLAAAFGAGGDESAGLVAQADGGADLVAVLAAGPGGAVHVDLALGDELFVGQGEAGAEVGVGVAGGVGHGGGWCC